MAAPRTEHRECRAAHSRAIPQDPPAPSSAYGKTWHSSCCWWQSTHWWAGHSDRNAPSCPCSLPKHSTWTYTQALTYILVFGLSKAAVNYFAGTLSGRYGRKPVLVTGWLVAIPVPLMLIFGPSWGWIVAANVFLGVSQGLTWSTAIIMKMDLVGPKQRGLAMGLNEAAGYLGVAVTALATGYIASTYGLRPGLFLLGAAYITSR